jgi:transcriptional regulator with XRE-family HTH domain
MLMAARDLRFRGLARRTREVDPEGKGLTHSYLAGIARGDEYPSIKALKTIARALDVKPDIFPEYRLAQARRLFDEDQVGLPQALSNLSIIEPLFEGPAREELREAVSDLAVQALVAEKRRSEAAEASAEATSRREGARQPEGP